tara:strand:+ start:2235 stop:2483 length:249 start_codon:yes stop_codon:yes gene_type:complete
MNWPTVEKNVPIPPRQNLVHKRRDKLKWVQKNMQEDDSFLCDSLEEAQNWVLTINLCEGYKGLRRQLPFGKNWVWRIWKIRK